MTRNTLDDKIIALYARGLTVREVQAQRGRVRMRASNRLQGETDSLSPLRCGKPGGGQRVST